MVETDLDARCGCGVNQDPFLLYAVWREWCVVGRAVVREATFGGGLQRCRAKVGRFDLRVMLEHCS